MKKIAITDEPISTAMALAPLENLGGGALASFTGIARADSGVVALELEHYPGMTEQNLHAVADAAMSRWSLLGCVLLHRVGKIAVGEQVVVVATAAHHRAEALDACAFLIDRLKTDAAFWKKEHRTDGSALWVEAKSTDDARAEKWREAGAAGS
jgi:molybdopterin synthase catalytic subunit